MGALTSGAGVSQPVVSKHLGVLERRDVQGRANGRQTHYRATPGSLAPLLEWTHEMNTFWDQSMNSLEDLLNRMDQ